MSAVHTFFSPSPRCFTSKLPERERGIQSCLTMSAVHTFISPSPRCFTSKLPLSSRFYSSVSSSSRPHYPCMQKLVLVRCSSAPGGRSESVPDVSANGSLSEIVGKRVEELLRSEGNKSLVDELERAEKRVQNARKELAEIKRQERETAQKKDYIQKLQTQASEIEECQRELSVARVMVKEAELALSSNIDQMGNAETGMTDREAERWESVKASAVSAAVGTLAGLPITLSQANGNRELWLHVAVNFISCALFGVTFRYAVRRDLDNIQLKSGTSAAFGFVKGLAELQGSMPSEFNDTKLFSYITDSALYVSENVFIFLFSAIGLDYCFKMRLLSPFPSRSSTSEITSSR